MHILSHGRATMPPIKPFRMFYHLQSHRGQQYYQKNVLGLYFRAWKFVLFLPVTLTFSFWLFEEHAQGDKWIFIFIIKYKVKVAQSCLTLSDPMDYIVHGILKARILEWVAFPFSRRSSQPRDQTQVSCIAGRFFTNWATRGTATYSSILAWRILWTV